MKGILGYTTEKLFKFNIDSVIDEDNSIYSLEKTKSIFKIQIAAYSIFSVIGPIGMRLPLESKLENESLLEKAVSFGIENNLAIPTAIALGSVVVESAMYHHRTSNRINELVSASHPTQ